MDAPTLLNRNGLLAKWRRLAATKESGQRGPYELDERGELLINSRLSARRQIVLTDVYCQLTEQMGHLAAMSVPVFTPSFGVKVPDAVWVPGDRWENFKHDDPVPFVPDLCAEILLDSDRTQEIDRRIESYLEGGASEVIVVSPRGQGNSGAPQASGKLQCLASRYRLTARTSKNGPGDRPQCSLLRECADAISSCRTSSELKLRHEASSKVGILPDCFSTLS